MMNFEALRKQTLRAAMSVPVDHMTKMLLKIAELAATHAGLLIARRAKDCGCGECATPESMKELHAHLVDHYSKCIKAATRVYCQHYGVDDPHEVETVNDRTRREIAEEFGLDLGQEPGAFGGELSMPFDKAWIEEVASMDPEVFEAIDPSKLPPGVQVIRLDSSDMMQQLAQALGGKIVKANSAEEAALFNEAFGHPKTCPCETCLRWWAMAGPDDGEPGSYGPFTKDQVNAEQRLRGYEVTD